VQDGGHRVPPDKIIARYERMRVNVKAALPFVDLAILVDNSSIQSPHRPVAATAGGKVIFRNPPLPWWAEEVLQGLPS
jgi:predicted ABC-type ATPase